jgi:hypothetical protein
MEFMKSILSLVSFAMFIGLSSCASNEQLENRLDSRNESYSNVQERRGMRKDARQGRTDAWFDRVMH